MYRIKVSTRTVYVFPFPVQSITGSGHKAMDVRMKWEVLSPGMDYSNRSGFNTKMRVSTWAKRIPNRSKKQVVIPPLVVQANGVQVVRNGKHQVVMFHRQGGTHQIINPESLFCRLAFGTVAVTVPSNRDCSCNGRFRSSHRLLHGRPIQQSVYFTLKVYRYFNVKVYHFNIKSKLVLSFLEVPPKRINRALLFW